ncbi:potassium channel family protein [Kaarinaea lacus]
MPQQHQQTWFHSLTHEHRFALLFFSLILFFLGSPLITIILGEEKSLWSDAIIAALYMVFMLTAIFTVSKAKISKIIGVAFAIPVAIMSVGQIITETAVTDIIFQVLAICYLCYAIVLIMKYIFDQQRVDANKIFAALCVYLLISLLWALLYSMIEVIQPGSFIYALAEAQDPLKLKFGYGDTASSLYYSLVTMTTLGYGDIAPTNAVARMFASTQAVIGQLYIAVLIARLVGLHASQNTQNN